jgi:uncharacterized protein (TIGR03086 family)
MLTLTDGRSQLEDAVRYALAISPHVTPDLLEGPTPCASWDLRMLLDHLNESVGMLAEGLATGSLSAEPAPAAPDAITDRVVTLRLRCARLLTACRTAPAGQLVTLGAYDLTASLMSCAGAIEVAVHAWDIAAACGSRQPIPSALAERMLQIAPLLVTDATRAGLFADPVPAPASTTPGDRLVALLGRHPAWQVPATPR